MQHAATILVALAVLGCAGEHGGQFPVDPIAQLPLEPATAWVWGMVVDGSGVCIPEATVRVLAGQRAGDTITQTTPCNAWGYDGGFFFTGLTAGLEMTLQVAAPGYEVQEKRVIPSAGPQMAILFTPSRTGTGGWDY